jgi:hypothetical protein
MHFYRFQRNGVTFALRAGGPAMPQSVKKKRRSTSAGAVIPWPVRIAMCESAIRKQDELLLKDGSPSPFVDLVVAETEARVKESGKSGSLEFLCIKGCPRRELLYHLGMCENRGVTNTVAMTGFESGELHKELKRIEGCAATIRGLNGDTFGEFGDYDERSTVYKFLTLPEMLLEYSALVKHAVKYIGGKSDFYLPLAKSLLVEFVYERTKDFHHAKVVDLLSVMLGSGYSELDHRIWYSKYLRRRKGYRADPADSPSLRMKKTLIEVHAAIIHRMDIHHGGDQCLRQNGSTIMRPE